MKAYIANTDHDWYAYLSAKLRLDEVNFWQPSGSRGFHAIPPGAPFLFKLKKPHYAICGYGYLGHTSILPAWLAWESFEDKNGAPTFEAMKSRIARYRRDHGEGEGGYTIGCLMISEPVFFPENRWVAAPRDWRGNIVQGSTYDLARGEGARVWAECLAGSGSRYDLTRVGEAEAPRHGTPLFVAPRLGQGTFRLAVVDAYARGCAVTGEHSLPVLEAAHIRPYGEGGEHEVRNGLLLRSDIHRLFDKGYVTVTPDYEFRVSGRLKDEFRNGRSYYGYDRRRIILPGDRSQAPDRTLLEWHAATRFLG